MNQSENRPMTPATAETTPQTQVQQIQQAMEQVERKKNHGKVTRRVLLGVVGVGVCAGAVEAAPFVIEKAGYYTEQELNQALQNGIAQGRAELLAELRNLEGIGLDTAIAIAKLTKFAVQYIVKPLADLSSAVGGDVLGALATGVSQARAILLGIPAAVPGRSGAVSTLTNLDKLLAVWQAKVSKDLMGQYALQDVTAAEAYLEALQQKINGRAAKGS